MKPVEIGTVRELGRADLERLALPRITHASRVTRMRDSHHRLARHLAMGKSHAEAAALSGYSPNSVSALMASPAFQELLAQKRAVVDEAFAEAVDEYTRIASANMVRAERLLSDRLEDADDPDGPKIATRDLISIVADRADRFGYPKTQVNANINHDFAARLERARQRSQVVLDGKAGPSASPALPQPAPASTPVPQAVVPFTRRAV